ncbi:hypothetical protein Thermo_00239 [Thermoplasmatales archaeon]|nr:hypothetical protein Thermo_00239 [Thermoplasmatales archaeon]
MKRYVILASIIVVIMFFSGFASLVQAGSPEISIPSYSSSLTSGTPYLNYTIYSAQGSFSRSMMMNYFNESGISTISYGSILQASVPAGLINDFIQSMSILERNFNITYFEDNSSILFQPFSVPSQMQVPFAYTPAEIALAYDYGPAYQSGLSGKGETIAIVVAFGDPTIKYDVMAFDKLMNLPPINLSLIYPPKSGPVQQANVSWALETATDVEWAHAMAPLAKINLVIAYDASNALLNAVSYSVENRLGSIISLSWGTPEAELGGAAIATSSQVFQQAQKENISVFAASGDFGAYDGTSQLTVNFPASDPFVTGVGGTSLYYNHIRGWYQYAWGGTTDGTSFGSGGGYSKLPVPYWQSAPGINSTMINRGVPDVSIVASVETGVEIIEGGTPKEVGGTSIGTPMWAAIGALIDQANGRDMGSINPMLYQISRTGLYKSAFTQILTGTNGYYTAAPGWNPVTGLGTPVVGKLINASREIMGTYGTVAIINSSGYNSTSISANLTLGSGIEQSTFNGSSLYYISAYSSSNNFLKVGISVQNGSYRAEYLIDSGGVLVSGSKAISFPAINSFSLSLRINSTNITAIAGTAIFHLNYLLPFIGDYHAAFGAEVNGSEYNLTNVSDAYFSNLSVSNGPYHAPASSIYVERYSQIPGEQNYSSIIITHYNSQYNVSYGTSGSDGFINGTSLTGTSITYSLSYESGIVGTFELNSGQTAIWSENGHLLLGNTFRFAAGGLYNITATISSPLSTYSKIIHIPSLFSTNITVTAYSTDSYVPTFNGLLDNFYAIGNLDTSKITVIGIYGNNSLELTGKGFYGNNVNFSAGLDTSITMQPINSSISLFVFQGNSTVTINNKTVSGSNGTYAASVAPGNAEISVKSPHYLPYNTTLSLLPAENTSMQVNLSESGRNPIISGRVTDVNFEFGLQGVNVSASNTSLYSYTNASGVYYIQLPTGTHTLNYSRALYEPLNVNLSVSANTIINVKLSPAKVQVFYFNLNIEKYFPIMFFALYLQWSQYTGTGFLYYQVSVSTTTTFDPGTVSSVSVSNQAHNTIFLTDIYPGNTYYVAISIHLSDGSVYSTNYVTVSYSNPVYLLANLAVLGGALFIIGMLIWIAVSKRDRWKF